MPVRFRRSIKLGPGVRLNVGKKSLGISAGVRGARYSVNTSGRRTTSIGIPGSGLSMVKTHSSGRRSSKPAQENAPPSASALSSLPKPGFLSSSSEKRFYEGVQAYLRNDFAKAKQAFESASQTDERNISDDLFAGIVAAKLDEDEVAIGYLEKVVTSDVPLPDSLMKKYLPETVVAIRQQVQVTPRIQLAVGFDSIGATFVLAELYQGAGRIEEAIGLLQQLESDGSLNDEALNLSLCDLYYQANDDEAVVNTAVGVANESDAGLACLHLKAKALARQGLNDAAIDAFTQCLKRTSGRDAELLRDIRYDRAGLYETLGQAAKARKDYEKIYAEDPSYLDVKQRLAMGG